MKMNIKCDAFKRSNKLLFNLYTRLKIASNFYDGNDYRYNITNNLPIKNLNSTNYEELSYISNDEDMTVLSNVEININRLKLLKNLMNKNMSEIEKLKRIEMSDEVFEKQQQKSIYVLNIEAGGLYYDWV
jgi:hypothetical protein